MMNMESYGFVVVLAVLAVIPAYSSGETCLSPEVRSKSHTTTDATISLDTAIVVEFSVTCKNGLEDQNLFAELNGQTMPASKVQGSNKKYDYQVSFSGEHKDFPAAQYNIRIYDEEGYSTFRKAQRSGDDVNTVKSLATVQVNHPGTSQGFFIQSELIAAIVSIIVCYFAYSAKSKLQSN